MTSYYAPSIFLNHGGGPNPVLGEKHNLEIAESLRDLPKYIDFGLVKAVILITGHREEETVVISSGERHGLVYDYTNFPVETYSYGHDAPGAPELATRVHDALSRAGIQASLDATRGWDHGTFIPMMLADPAAKIPILQVSILSHQRADSHFELGRALAPFRAQGIAIIGSGMSYHNMEELEKGNYDNDGVVVNESFHSYLKDVCSSESGRRRILTWDEKEGAMQAHPKGEADHFMPLIVSLGAAGSDPCQVVFDSTFKRKFRLAGFVWRV